MPATIDLIPKCNIPEGFSGDWKVKRFTVSEEDAAFHNLRCRIKRDGRSIRAGTYTKLCFNGAIVMSDTPAEMSDHAKFVRLARGRVLINGLGLGMCAVAVLEKPEVEHVTVIEKSHHVYRLVAPHIIARYEDRVTIYEADALTWKPPTGERWDVVWHDIWTDICSDNAKEMTGLKRKYGRRCWWQGCWCEDEVRDARW